MQYYDLSAKSNYNIEKPFLYLLRRLLGNDTQYAAEPAVTPATIEVDIERLQKFNEELEAIGSIPIPTEEDENL